jgi:hypothetical protein
MTLSLSSRSYLVLLVAGYSLAIGHAADLGKVWTLDVAPVPTAEDHDVNQIAVTALRFSPDGSRIAVAVDATRLLIVDIHNPHNPMQQFLLSAQTGADDSDSVPSRPPVISWSPSGKALIAGGDLITLENGVKCTIPGIGAAGWLSSDHAVAYGRGKPNRLEFFDSRCKREGAWNLGGTDWDLLDVSSARGLVVMLQATGTAQKYSADVVVADTASRKIIQRWPELETGYIARFADSGKILCAGEGGDHSAPPEIHPRCMDVDSGRLIAQAKNVMGGPAFAAAERASRIVATDHRASWNFRYFEADTVLKRRVVWDIKDNVELASWKPNMQLYDVGGPKPIKLAYTFAISPDGRLIAQGGNGTLTLYRLEAGSGDLASRSLVNPPWLWR